ncbi:MAG: glycosyltransferase family 39 protein [Holophaga sp.]|nr:glycosyltransferase family 39 protein [Holophaga sp.]
MAGLLFGTGLNNHTLWDYHEPYVAGIIHEMTTRGDWIVPTLDGQPYLEKPPLFYWMAVLSCKAAGSFAPWALRLPSALMAVGTVAWVGWLGCRVQSVRAGVWAGLLTAGNVLFFQMGHQAVVDITLTATVTLALGLAFLALVEAPGRRWVDGFWASLGLVFLAKGVVGPVMVLWPVAVVLLLKRDRSSAAAFLRPGWGMALGLGLALAWAVPLALRGGREFLTEVFVRNTLGRFLKHPDLVSRTGRLDEHREPFTFYLARSPGNLCPWLAVWIAAMLPVRRGRAVLEWGIPALFLAVLLLLSLSSGKRMVYLLPVLPITFLHTALWLDRVLRGAPGRMARAALWATLGLTFLLSVGLPWFALGRAGMPWFLALPMSLLVLPLGAVAVARARRRDLAGALAWCLAQWLVAVLAFTVLAVPYLDREWSPILEPYRIARRLEDLGAGVHQGRLGEGQVGFVNLILGHRLPPVESAAAVRAVLAESRPQSLLIEPIHFWRRELHGQVEGGLEILTEGSQSGKIWDRTPVLVVNRSALDLLSDGED